jgi:hypothetical protein
MDLELWSGLSAAISAVDRRWPVNRRDTHSTARIVRVHLWSCLHDRPACWACDKRNWTAQICPDLLPDQSTLSRRMGRDDFQAFLSAVGQRLNGKAANAAAAGKLLHLRIVDGKPLEIPHHSKDRNATFGRGAGRTSRGYKLHWLINAANSAMPDGFVITSLDVCEKQMAARMIKRLKPSCGYLLGDAHYDASWLYDLSSHHGQQLICPRAKPQTGLGHHYQSEHRLRAINLLEAPGNGFGPQLYHQRGDIERANAHLVSFGGGLSISLPAWVRRIWRVRRWVIGKLLINAARIRLKRAVGA